MEKKVLYMCYTEYALLNCMKSVANNVLKKEQKSDVLIFHRTENMKKISSRLKQTSIFDNVYDFKYINELSTLNKILCVAMPFQIMPQYNMEEKFPDFSDYNVLISQCMLFVLIVTQLSNLKEIYLIDEGLSSYTGRTINSNKRNIYWKIFRKIIFNKRRVVIDGEILNSPQMLSSSCSKVNIYDLNKSETNESVNIYEIFPYVDHSLYKKNYTVYLGTPVEGLMGLLERTCIDEKKFKVRTERVLKKCFDFFENENIIYRMHPNESKEKVTKKFQDSNVLIDEVKNTWELEVQKYIGASNILISFFSTACFTPKLLFDREPVLIFLYRIFDESFYNADETVEKFRDLYRNKNKIIVLNSIEELYDLKILNHKGVEN